MNNTRPVKLGGLEGDGREVDKAPTYILLYFQASERFVINVAVYGALCGGSQGKG